MQPASSMSLPRVILLATLSAFAIHCDRGIEPFDPNEEPALPDLARIYPDGSKRAAGPPGPGMPSARPAASRENGQPAAESAGAGATLSGVVEIADALYGSRPARGMLFIIARSQPTGPPLAVLRVPSPSFPHAFEIGQAQVMIPSLRFTGEVKLSARLDSDGNAMTKLPGDLVGEIANPLVPGSSGIVLLLDQKL